LCIREWSWREEFLVVGTVDCDVWGDGLEVYHVVISRDIPTDGGGWGCGCGCECGWRRIEKREWKPRE